MTRWNLYLLALGCLSQTACFRGLFSEGVGYQAQHYLVDDTPRIVALQHTPLQMISGAPAEFNALLLTHPEDTVGKWKISVCGLGKTTTTYIWNLSCFEDSEEVTVIATGSTLPIRYQIPEFPEISNCGYSHGDHPPPENPRDMPLDTGYDTGYDPNQDCAHHLPLLVETTVNDKPVFAGAFTYWYPNAPSFVENTQSLSSSPQGIIAPSTAHPGEEIALEYRIHQANGYPSFHWYIDDGTLLDTGITAPTSIDYPSLDYPNGRVITKNRLVVPEEYHGSLRVWAVAHYPWMDQIDMTWTLHTIEIE